uniref:Aspartyl/Glutamyl-tRNA(Gln) amidotransferase subunit B/E catalytic domain-containing protein n=1 Tax=Arcella intermedia TaxID=1963864 RepID=A0A6B2L5M4_9EUKA
MEIHAQIVSNTKLFSSARNSVDCDPNTCVSFVDAAFPGTLPVLNEHCVFQALRTGIALNGRINTLSRFDRKHYFYHDLPMGYQITQYFEPIVSGGVLDLYIDEETTKTIRIDRIQLETDSGKSIHDAHPHLTLIDLNRAGIGLFEIISQPDINSPLEAGLFLKQMIFLLNHIGASPALMGQGSLRCDANVSVRKAESKDPLGERCEIKNLNSVKSLVNAIEYEAKRQVELLESGNVVEMETRWFDPVSKTTFTARKKEDKIDYRFFPEPDLPPIIVEQNVISSAHASMPKLPSQIIDELLETFKSSGITKKMAHLICYEQGGVEYFKSAVQEDPSLSPLIIMQWLLNDIFGFINADVTLNFNNLPMTPKQLVQLIQLTEAEYVSGIPFSILTFQ